MLRRYPRWGEFPKKGNDNAISQHGGFGAFGRKLGLRVSIREKKDDAKRPSSAKELVDKCESLLIKVQGCKGTCVFSD